LLAVVGVERGGVGGIEGTEEGRVSIWPTSARPIATTSKAITPPITRAETTRQVGVQPYLVLRSSKVRLMLAGIWG
jgi:hypothetical protein